MYILSVLIPCFNSRTGLSRVLEPLLVSNLACRNSIEIIISDDSSYPLLSDLDIAKYQQFFYHFRYIYNHTPLGAVKNWNQLISICNGRYYWVCHHDEYLADNLKGLSSIIEHISCIDCDIFLLPLYKSYKFSHFSLLQAHSPPTFILNILLKMPSVILLANPIGPPSTIIVKSSNSLLYDTNLKWFVDVEFYLRLLTYASRSVNILPNSCKIISDQNFDQSITRSMSQRLGPLKVKELNYIERKCAINPRTPLILVFFIKCILLILRSFRSKIVILRFQK